jgi:hypothetical protein
VAQLTSGGPPPEIVEVPGWVADRGPLVWCMVCGVSHFMCGAVRCGSGGKALLGEVSAVALAVDDEDEVRYHSGTL